jgi:hypothetical protein
VKPSGKKTHVERFDLRAAVLLFIAAGIAGWAFFKVIEPQNTLELLRLFSSC